MSLATRLLRAGLTVAVVGTLTAPLADAARTTSASLPDGPRLAALTTMSSEGSRVTEVVLPKATTIPLSGLVVRSWSLTETSWAAVLLARQGDGQSPPIAPFFVGSARVASGPHSSAVLPLFGQVQTTDASSGVTLPAGAYGLYVLTAPGGQARVQFELPGLSGATALVGYVPVSSQQSQVVASGTPNASTDFNLALRTTRQSGIVMTAATSSAQTHHLALCIAATSASALADLCASPDTTSAKGSKTAGPLEGQATATAAVVGPGTYVAQGRLDVAGVGAAGAITAISWEWTPAWLRLTACHLSDVIARTTVPSASYRSDAGVLPTLVVTSRSEHGCELPVGCPPPALVITDSHGNRWEQNLNVYLCVAGLRYQRLLPHASVRQWAGEWDPDGRTGRFTIEARWRLLDGALLTSRPAAFTVR